MDLFGFEFKRKEKQNASFVPKETDDGAVNIEASGFYGVYVDMDGSIRTEAELVSKYREMAEHPEVDLAIDDIINEFITEEPEVPVVELLLDSLEQPERIKNLLQDEFKVILQLLEFEKLSYEIARRWYVDGRLYYHAIVDQKNLTDGIKELRYIDPRKIRKIRQQKKVKSQIAAPIIKDEQEFFIYNDKGFAKTSGTNVAPTSSTNGIKIAKDSIIHCTSGLPSANGDLVKSYLHKAIKPLNQLRSMEDSLVIYRVSRAPERRVFYIDVGGLPKAKAEQHMQAMMTKFKNRVVYDSATGQIRDDRKHVSMLEDFWFARREGGRGTEVSVLPGGQNLDSIEDIQYFQRKLYKSLNVPISRMESDNAFNMGRSSEISRDEVKFAKFISRLRKKFSNLFLDIFEKQLILKNIITPEEWDDFKGNIKFKYSQDNYYAELKETEILRDRMAMLRDVNDYTGIYYSHEWVRRNVLRQSDEDIKDNDKQIAAEKNNPQFNPPVEPGEEGSQSQPDPSGPQQLEDLINR